MDDTRAFYWIASGETYIREATASARSAYERMPDVTRIIGIPSGTARSGLDAFDCVYLLDTVDCRYWFHRLCHYQLQMVKMMNKHGVEQAVYMDTDTYVCAPAYDLFSIVSSARYTIAGTHAPGRITGRTRQWIPEVFPEINIGVNPIWVEDCILLWKLVCERYDEAPEAYGNNDQSVLREVLFYNSDIFRLYILPPEYNMRLFPYFVCGEVKILHGRSGERYEIIAGKINQKRGMRLWYQGNVLE